MLKNITTITIASMICSCFLLYFIVDSTKIHNNRVREYQHCQENSNGDGNVTSHYRNLINTENRLYTFCMITWIGGCIIIIIISIKLIDIYPTYLRRKDEKINNN